MRWGIFLLACLLAGCVADDGGEEPAPPVDPVPMEPEMALVSVKACVEACPQPAANTVVEVRDLGAKRSDVGGFTDDNGMWQGEVPLGINAEVRVGGLDRYTTELIRLDDLTENVSLEITVYHHRLTINHTATLDSGYNGVGFFELPNTLHPDPALNAIYTQRLWSFGVILTWDSGIGNNIDVAPCAGYGNDPQRYTTDAEAGPNPDGDFEVRLSLSDSENAELSSALQGGKALKVCFEVRSESLTLQDVQLRAMLGGYFIGPFQDGIT